MKQDTTQALEEQISALSDRVDNIEKRYEDVLARLNDLNQTVERLTRALTPQQPAPLYQGTSASQEMIESMNNATRGNTRDTFL